MLLPEKCSCGRPSKSFKELDMDADQLKELRAGHPEDVYVTVWECQNCQRQYTVTLEYGED